MLWMRYLNRHLELDKHRTSKDKIALNPDRFQKTRSISVERLAALESAFGEASLDKPLIHELD